MVDIFDLFLIIFLGVVAYIGARQGVVKRLCVAVGVIGGLCITAFAYGSLASLSDKSTVRTLLLFILLLAIVLLCYSTSLTLGGMLERRWPIQAHRGWRLADMMSGSVIAVFNAGFTIWIIATMFGSVGPQFMQQQIANSQLLMVTSRVADAPPLFRGIKQLLHPFTAPTAFADVEPAFNGAKTSVDTQFGELDTVVDRASPAVVKIDAWGCGSTAEGSGFMIGKRLIMTNAHILAGAGRVSIETGGATLTATPVWFDPKLDDAVLMTDADLPAAPLTLRTKVLTAGSIGAVIGYPEGGSLKVQDATILQLLNATGYDIYGKQKTNRDLYAIRSTIEPGNSGSPLIDTNGQVAGLVFGNSTSQSSTGYAIAASQLSAVVKAVSARSPTVSTGACEG